MNRGINEVVAGGLSTRFGRASGQPELISAQARELLNLRRLPAMLNPQQAAAILGVCEHDIANVRHCGKQCYHQGNEFCRSLCCLV